MKIAQLNLLVVRTSFVLKILFFFCFTGLYSNAYSDPDIRFTKDYQPHIFWDGADLYHHSDPIFIKKLKSTALQYGFVLIIPELDSSLSLKET